MQKPSSSDLISATAGKKRPVRMLALLLVCFASLALIGLQGWSMLASRETQIHNATVATENMARALADHADSAFDLVDTILGGVADTVQHEGIDAERERLQRQLAAGVARAPLLDALSIMNERGERMLGSPAQAAAADGAAAAIVRHHRSRPGSALHIGAPYRHRADSPWLLPVTRRLVRPDGSFAGVALAEVRLSVFRQYYESFDVGPKGMILLALDGGTLAVQHPLARTGAQRDSAGSDIGNAAMFALWRSGGDAGSASSSDAGDQVNRLYSYRHVRRYPLLVSVALSEDDVLAGWRAGTTLSSLGVLLVLLVVLWMAVRLLRHVRQRDLLEAQLRNAQEGLVTKNRSLKLLARNDGLTGIANRRHFDARLDTEFKRAAREGSSLALVLMDVDHFKKYNDHYGHPGGDACLHFIGQCIRAGRRSSRNLAARVGGEEFAILLPDTDLYGAIAIADSVRKAIANAQREHAGNPAGIVTVSCGVHALLPGQGKASPKMLVEAADAALYQAKAKGRNCVNPDAVDVALRAHRLPVSSP